MVIARALARQARLLILDEPTAALGKAEVDLLFKLIERMRAQGTAIIYVSHRLDEIKLLCDRVMALRDGEVVAELKRGAYTYQDLVLAISGQKIQQMAASIPPPDAPVLLAADAHYNKIDESLSMRAGWVSGLHGLLGSGIENLLRCLFGACDTCQMDTPAGKTLLSNPGAAIRAGIGYVPSERFHAIVPHMSVRDNIVLPHLQHFARIGGTINRRALDAAHVDARVARHPRHEVAERAVRQHRHPARAAAGARERDRRVHLGAAHRLQLRRAAVGQERGGCC